MDNVKEKQAKYFFVPRIGAKYSEGFRGLKTLVVGAYHVCYCNCQHKHLCCNINTIASMDYKCPAYKNALPALKRCTLPYLHCIYTLYARLQAGAHSRTKKRLLG